MRVLLVDDEPLALDRLKVGLRGVPDVTVVGTAADGVEAAERIAELRPDLAILDIQMPGRTGMELAATLADDPERPEIVFVTAFERFAPDAFAVEAADYLLKPVSFDRLRLAIERARRRRLLRDRAERAGELEVVVEALREDARRHASPEPRYDDGIWVPVKGGSVRVDAAAINSIEAARDYVMINTDLKSHILRATMGEIAGRLDPAQLLRVHRSHIVRLGAVTGCDRPGKGVLRLRLADGTAVQVGPLYVEEVEAALGLG